jgi:predicted HTH domain antitoxin
MSTITIPIPDVILESHQQNLEHIRKDVQIGLVIWEYLNGRLSLRECGTILKIGHRGFLELLWNKGIPIDGLSEDELEQQLSAVRNALDT